MNGTEGVVRFHAERIPAPPPSTPRAAELLQWRDRLRTAGLIGVYPDGIGYGNVSVRSPDGFIITGTQTGVLERLGTEHLTEVIGFDLDANALTCRGPIAASSESLTHAAIYGCDGAIGAVVHVHHPLLWQRLLDLAPTTDRRATYGTPAMAFEIQRLCSGVSRSERLVVMGGHADGLISFGATLEEAAGRLLAEVALAARQR